MIIAAVYIYKTLQISGHSKEKYNKLADNTIQAAIILLSTVGKNG